MFGRAPRFSLPALTSQRVTAARAAVVAGLVFAAPVAALAVAAPARPIPPAAGPQQAAGEPTTLETAEALLSQGDAAAALAAAESIVAGDPFEVEAHHLIQRILRRRDRAGMLARYQDLARRYPSSPAAQYLLGNALLNAEDMLSARIYFDRALQLDPGFGWAASINAVLAQVDGNGDEALRLGEISVQDIRDDVITATLYADLLRLNGMRDEAIRFLEQAANLNADDPRYLLELWKLRMRGVENYEAERAAFAWQVAAHRERFLATPELAAELARFYRTSAMADTDGARELWLALANRFPTSAEAKNALLRAASMTDGLDDRLELYERIVAEYPDSPIRYEVYFRMLNDLIRQDEFERAEQLARRLTTEPDPGRLDDAQGVYEKPTPWGYTLQGIGYAGWFAAAQAAADAPDRAVWSVRDAGEREQPISPAALAAARALDTSSCNDPRSLEYVARYLLESSHHRLLGIRLMERARRAADDDPLTEVAYGAEYLEETREHLARMNRKMPIYYVLAGMLPEAEQAVAEALAALPPLDSAPPGTDFWGTHFAAARVYGIVGRWRDAARHYLIAEWHRPTLPALVASGYLEELGRIHAEIGPPEIRRYEPGRGPRLPVMRAGLEPVEGAASLDATALGGELLLIVFWARRHETSSAQVLALDALTLELEDPRLSTLAIAVERPSRIGRDGLDAFARHRAETALTISMARAGLETIDRLDLIGLPTTLLLDATGRVLARQLGFHVDRGTWSQQWRAIVQEELGRLASVRTR